MGFPKKTYDNAPENSFMSVVKLEAAVIKWISDGIVCTHPFHVTAHLRFDLHAAHLPPLSLLCSSQEIHHFSFTSY